MKRRFALAVLLAMSFEVLSAQPRESVAQSARSILNAHCVACHGEARMSGLDLRTLESVRQGGTRGAAVVPGNSDASLLLKAVNGLGGLSMPPSGDALGQDEIQALAEWIDAGAVWESLPGGPAAPSWWSFEKPRRPDVPHVAESEWGENPIDAFILRKLNERGLEPAPRASRATLARRVYFDLHGLPPPPSEVERFVEDESEGAYEELIDRLLESERYGERWGRYWLDLVRYADTSGFETDHYYTTAWRYRDYVIKAFNEDKPYTTFVTEQIAADEQWPTDTDLEGTLNLPVDKRKNLDRRIGTSLFTLGAFPIEYTYYGDLYRAEWSAEAVDLIGSVFLGLTLECARCHDHKSDPISQRDYYRMTAFFAGSEEQEVPLGSLFDIQTSTRRFPLEEHARALKRMARRSRSSLSASEERELLERLGRAFLSTPDPLPTAKVLGHREVVPSTYVLAHGDFRKKGEQVAPGVPPVLARQVSLRPIDGAEWPPRRRAALAEWLTSPDHPLFARVMVNRIWQHHFGAGIVRSANDFGRQGETPSHPELLDWLAVEFRDRGWSVKQMHRLIMTSRTYRNSSVASERGLRVDPSNRYFGRMSRRRLDADAIRDAVLAVAGNLNLKMGGAGVIVPLTKEEILAARMPHLWPAHPDPADHARRSVYLEVKRSMAVPMLQIFDAPDTARSCARRETSTVAPQALAMMNSAFLLEQARTFAGRLSREADSSPEGLVNWAWKIALGRTPAEAERQTAVAFLRRNSLPDLCLMVFNMNEFIYVD